jgi:hypothetical protein
MSTNTNSETRFVGLVLSVFIVLCVVPVFSEATVLRVATPRISYEIRRTEAEFSYRDFAGQVSLRVSDCNRDSIAIFWSALEKVVRVDFPRFPASIESSIKYSLDSNEHFVPYESDLGRFLRQGRERAMAIFAFDHEQCRRTSP